MNRWSLASPAAAPSRSSSLPGAHGAAAAAVGDDSAAHADVGPSSPDGDQGATRH